MRKRVAIGIDMGGTNIKSGIVTLDGEIVYESVVSTPAFAGKDGLLSRIEEIALSLIEIARKSGAEPVGVGIGTAGFVDVNGVVGEATNNLPGWSNTRVKEEMEARLLLPVTVDNDVNAMATGEMWLGAGRDQHDFICITLGTGVGGSLVQNGKVYRGRDGFAGALGHQKIQMDGELCTCGQQGCWEQYASVTALKRQMCAAGLHDMTTIQLFDEMSRNNLTEKSVIDKYSHYIAIGLANLIHIFNPGMFIIGGAITAQGDLLFGPIRNYVKELVLGAHWKNGVVIKGAELGNSAGMIGAAKQALELGE